MSQKYLSTFYFDEVHKYKEWDGGSANFHDNGLLPGQNQDFIIGGAIM